ncbi:MAG TPA: alpha/beta hydrolase [Spirochaetia bacterium]|nr:alpha/beta hydrolase [Spirochaetia bacterium]
MSAAPRSRPGLAAVLWSVAGLAAAAAGLGLWASLFHRPLPEALASLQGTERVAVTTSPWGVFQPRTGKPRIGLVLYPASRVDWRSYAPAALAMARQGILVVVVPMPFNIAALDPDRAKDVVKSFKGIRLWAIAGHAEGGAIAARFAARNPSLVRALVLWAARPAAGDNLSASRLAVLSVSASRDGIVTPLVVRGSAWLLPAATRWVTIEGGNHAQFGSYGAQWRDGAPLISREQQQEKAVRATVEMLKALPM